MRHALAGLTLAAGLVLGMGAEAHGCRDPDPFCGPLPRTVIVPSPQHFGHPAPLVIKPRVVHPHRRFGDPEPLFTRRPIDTHRHLFVPRHRSGSFFFHSPHRTPHGFHSRHRAPHGAMKFRHRRF